MENVNAFMNYKSTYVSFIEYFEWEGINGKLVESAS